MNIINGTTMRQFFSVRAALALIVGAGAIAGCFETPVAGDANRHPHPPVTARPFDRDLPAEAELTTVHQQGDTVYFFGGRRPDGRAVASVWAFDLGSGKWIERAPMPTARYYAGVVAVRGMIYVIGGRERTASGEESERIARTVERYDPAKDQWTTLPSVAIDGFDGTYPTFFASAAGRIFSVSTSRTSSSRTWLFESTDGITWSRRSLSITPVAEPTLMFDGRVLKLMTMNWGYLDGGFHLIDPTTKEIERGASGYDWLRGYTNRWIELDGEIYNLNGYEHEEDILAVNNGRGWGFNSIPYDVTTNRHFTPIVLDRGAGSLYIFAPPQIRIGVHYQARENRFQ